MSRNRYHRGLALATALVGSFLLPGCGGANKAAKAGENEYRFALSGELKGFDPALSNDVPSSRVLGALYEGLLQYHYLDRPYRVIPALADGMPVQSPDGLGFTFKIKKGVKFHPSPAFGKNPDGSFKTRDLTAHDFVFAWKRLADPKTMATGWWVLDGWIEGLDAWRKTEGGVDYAAEVAGLKAPDDHTLEVRLTKPYPQFLYVCTMVFLSPIAKEAVEFYKDEFLNHPVGTGPYLLKEFVPNSRVVLDRNPAFRPETYPTTGDAWAKSHGMLADAGKKMPFIDRIVYKIIVESQPRWLEFRRGKLDRASIPKDNFEGVMASSSELGPDLKKDGVQLQIWPSQTQWWVGMNMKDPVFAGQKGLHLRRAIAYSHDAEKFLRVIYNGRGRVADSVFPPMLAAYEKAAVKHRFDYDPAKAKAELAAAGWPGGKGAPKLKFDLRGSGSLARQIAEFCKRGLEEIGLEVELVSNTWPQFLRKANAGQLQVYWGGWVGDYPDEENWLQLLYGPNGTPGPNYSNYDNPKYNELYLKVRGMTDSPARRALIHEMNNLALADVPWRMSFTQTDYVIHHRWLKNFMYADPIYNWQKYLRIDFEDRAKGLR